MEFSVWHLGWVWVILSPLLVHRGQRLKSALFAALCMATLAFQVEFFQAIDKPTGVFDILTVRPEIRGLIGYSVAIGLYLVLSVAILRMSRIMFLAATLSLYMISVLIMTLVFLL